MNPISIAKGVLALAGMVVFFLGVQSGAATLRWTGIGLVAAAWLLRFAKGGAREEPSGD